MMPPSAIAGDRVNREYYMQVRGYGCTTPAGLETIRHTGRLRTLPARTGSRLTAQGITPVPPMPPVQDSTSQRMSSSLNAHSESDPALDYAIT